MPTMRALLALLVCAQIACNDTGLLGRPPAGDSQNHSADADGSNTADDGGNIADTDGGDPLVPPDVRAFPGAEGFGALATGGRGGRVIKVITLAADGPGSLQEALDQQEDRIIVFAVSGVIENDLLMIRHGNVTIAGQTAPGAGITINGRLYSGYPDGADNIIIRHLRIRPEYGGSGGDSYDGIQLSGSRLLMLDHLSVAFGVDETMGLGGAEEVTVQWSTVESSATAGHSEGQHNYGLLSASSIGRVSIHHNLFAHHQNRCPAVSIGPAEVRNNVVYNVRHGFVHHNAARGPFNIVGNYFRAGPVEAGKRLIPFYFDGDPAGAGLAYYLADNYVNDPDNGSGCGDADGVVVDNPWTECTQNLVLGESFRSETELEFAASHHRPVATEPSTRAYDSVLDHAGAFPRDVVTLRAVAETRNRSGTWGAHIPEDYMAGLVVADLPDDLDDDGMADAWEDAHDRLSSSNPEDHQLIMPSGYTAIEEYINGLADQLLP